MIQRGEIWWADLGEPTGAEPGFRRPVLVVQADAFNRSRIDTVVVVAITSNMRLGEAPGNVTLSRRTGGLPKPSVINVSQITTLDKSELTERIGRLPPATMEEVDEGLKLVLGMAF